MKDLLRDFISLPFCFGSVLFRRRGGFVLVYHSAGKIAREDDPYKMDVGPALFKEQMQLVASLASPNVQVTFDDGFRNILEYAIPLVLRYNIKTTVFVTTGFIDGDVSFGHLFKGQSNPGPLSWQQIREMADSGVEIGSHAITHRDLTGLDYNSALQEIGGSKKIIEEHIGRRVKYFAYPFGCGSSFNAQIKHLVSVCGYEAAFTNIMGFNGTYSNPYELKRIRVYCNDNMLRFKMKIRGAYNWVDKIC